MRPRFAKKDKTHKSIIRDLLAVLGGGSVVSWVDDGRAVEDVNAYTGYLRGVKLYITDHSQQGGACPDLHISIGRLGEVWVEIKDKGKADEKYLTAGERAFFAECDAPKIIVDEVEAILFYLDAVIP